MPWGQMGSGGETPPFFTSSLDGSEWLASRPGRFTPKETAPDIHWVGGLAVPRDSLEAVK
jgi:hypothetical protein